MQYGARHRSSQKNMFSFRYFIEKFLPIKVVSYVWDKRLHLTACFTFVCNRSVPNDIFEYILR